MTTRYKKLKEKLSGRAAELWREMSIQAAQIPGGWRVGQALHAMFGLAPNEVPVFAVFVNRLGTPLEDEIRFHCHICEESLSPGNVASWPVLVRRTDGSSFQCVISTCADESCKARLFEKLEREGP